jgi:predicted outer membrane lipoprotein
MMKTLFQFLLYMVIAVLVIVLGVILGAEASWYFAWLVGTVMIVLISAAGGALMDAQEDEKKRNPG